MSRVHAYSLLIALALLVLPSFGESVEVCVNRYDFEKTENGWQYFRCHSGYLNSANTFRETYSTLYWYSKKEKEFDEIKAVEGKFICEEFELKEKEQFFASSAGPKDSLGHPRYVVVGRNAIPTSRPTTQPWSGQYVLKGSIPKLAQKKDWACWAAATAMLKSWKDGKPYTVEGFIKSTAGREFEEYYLGDTGLNGEQLGRFLDVIGLKSEPSACYSVGGFSHEMNTNGPLLVIYNPSADVTSKIRHAVVAEGLSGDGTEKGTKVTYIDPADGEEHSDKYLDFMKKYETGSMDGVEVQLAHF